jgi:hypothetical protein
MDHPRHALPRRQRRRGRDHPELGQHPGDHLPQEAYSLAGIIVLIVVYFILNSGGGSTISAHSPHRAACSRAQRARGWPTFDAGRSTRGNIDRRVENFMSELQRVLIVHATDENGQEVLNIETQMPFHQLYREWH